MEVQVRLAGFGDIPAIDALFRSTYPRLLKDDYPPSILVTSIQKLARAEPSLVSSGTYFVAVTDTERLVGAGGWAPWDLFGNADGTGHVRHFVTDVSQLRQGIGRALLTRTMEDAASRGVRYMSCMSTRTAEKFYAAMGFKRVQDEETGLEVTGGIAFPVIAMTRRLG